MKGKTTIIVIAILAVLVIWGISSYNGLVKTHEGVQKAWGDVENQYQRRTDLIPSLVNTVKGYAAHEQKTFTDVVEARAKATQVSLNVDDINEASLKKFQEAQGQVSSALGRLMAISESYPDLKANTNFLEFQAQLEGTENRIAVARNAFNEAAREYNMKRRRFPTVLIAGFLGFENKPYFQAEAGAEKAPVVEF